MVEFDSQEKVISRKNEGFPEWLDFDKLREQGIDYLGKLSGKIWTDHNVHDPGITILEVLCYVLLDLGYRTSLPSRDLFAKDPNDESPENNFFTAAQILTCNPLTITDYRKLLVDIPGVKNAWLTVAEDISVESICNRGNYVGYDVAGIPLAGNNDCIDFLNGLYHIYLEIDPNIPRRTELKEMNKNTRAIEDVTEEVKKVLMAHRNLCEDFYDITVLCKQKVGVCADIELHAHVDPEKIFIQLVNALREFFSPSPKFYRLNQLLEKGKSIEEIFAGRPYNILQSHGFLDSAELEQITLRKEIHLSDVYNVIFSIDGIASVKNLTLKNCDGSVCRERLPNPWIFKLFENHIPEFDIGCSGFLFTSTGGKAIVDIKRLARSAKFEFSNNGKTLMFAPSKDLDLIPEPGNYRADLAHYYPIENEFPKVYGIAEGSLPDEVSPQRKSQALQLRGYLLFFDTLLAGYLSQLKNIRNLFAMSGAKEKKTYFINNEEKWPALEKLVAYDLSESTHSHKPKAIPVKREVLEALIDSSGINVCDWEDHLVQYMFNTTAEREVAIHQFIEDVKNDNSDESVFSNARGCWYFFLFTSSQTIAVISPKPFPTEDQARKALDDLKLISADSKNFRRFSESGKTKFSFSIVLSATGYWNYLQLLTENEQLYSERRNSFLNHLLSRFAETFTDYALLSHSFLTETALQEKLIAGKESFLSSYPELSSTRGKAYDYLSNGWNNTNVSGLEKRFAAFSGNTQAKQDNLCHFEVEEFDEQTIVNVAWKGESIFTSEQSFESREEGVSAFNKMIKASTDPGNYKIDFARTEDRYKVGLHSEGMSFYYPVKFETAESAEKASMQLYRMLSPSPLRDDVHPSQFQHFPSVTGSQNSWKRLNPVINREEQFQLSADLLTDFKDQSQWIAEGEDVGRDNIELVSNPSAPLELINIKAFDPYVNRVDVKNKKTLYQYTISDLQKTFFFISEKEFESETEAHNDLLSLLFLLILPSNYQVIKGAGKDYLVTVSRGNDLLARNTIEFENDAEAQKSIDVISKFINENIFRLTVESRPVRWRYNLKLGLPDRDEFLFEASNEHEDPEDALKDAYRIANPSADLTVSPGDANELRLTSKKNPEIILAIAHLPEEKNVQESAKQANEQLGMKRMLRQLHDNPSSEELREYVVADSISKQGNFGYRLVKKNHSHAWYKSHRETGPRDSKGFIKDVYKQYNSYSTYLQLCYGREIIHERKDQSGILKYHYQIIPLSTETPHGIVLYESVRGYLSADEALKAFDREHVHILTLGTDETQYGSVISVDEVFNQTHNKVNSSSPVVFIPAETMKYFGYNLQHASHELSKLAKTYPVRKTKASDDRFAEYFLCGKNPAKEDDNCAHTEEPALYYFVYQNIFDDNGFWVSSHYFQSHIEALHQFNFFLILLRYKGNYDIQRDECDCKWKLYLREILAESKKRYPTAEEAWGKDGVQQFICTSQSKDAFPMYRKTDDCCYSFHVACGNLGLIHPCHYDSAEKRDQALRRLYKASSHMLEEAVKNNEGETWERMAVKIANSITDLKNSTSACDTLTNLIERISHYNDPSSELPGNRGLNPISRNHGHNEKLKWFATYFPIRKKRIEGSEGYQYFLNINLPDFCEEHSGDLEPCGCDENRTALECCCTAWISECCFDTCEEALRYYYRMSKCLQNVENYYPVFDCDCNSYGIRFHCDCESEKREIRDTATGAVHPEEKNHHCCNEIVAYNPQCYTSPRMVCEAINRAKGLINAEGLHLVEHILLRPHKGGNDCDCLIDTCRLPSPCSFEWSFPKGDPCKEGTNYCFVPGTDPYSFIATVALPAWPQRFRKKENRKLVEQLLYREVPAHILLRILWLTPEDLCQFETIYYQWTKWLGNKKVCADYSPPCKLIDLLFNYSFKCFECDECDPCIKDQRVQDPCNLNKELNEDINEYVNTINGLYCWNPICEPRQDSFLPEEDIGRDFFETPEPHEGDVSAEERVLELRFGRYREKVKEISDASAHNTNADIAMTFLNHPSPDFNAYAESVETIAANKRTSENRRVLSMDQKRELIRVVTWYYLDKLMIDEKIIEHDQPVKDYFRKLEVKKLLPDLKKWPGTQLTKLKPDVDVREIKKLFKK